MVDWPQNTHYALSEQKTKILFYFFIVYKGLPGALNPSCLFLLAFASTDSFFPQFTSGYGQLTSTDPSLCRPLLPVSRTGRSRLNTVFWMVSEALSFFVVTDRLRAFYTFAPVSTIKCLNYSTVALLSPSVLADFEHFACSYLYLKQISQQL